MFKSIADFEKSFPGVKSLSPEQKAKCLEIFNAMKKEGVEDGKAIAVAMTKAKGMKMDHFFIISPIKLEESGTPVSSVEVLRVGTIQDRGLNVTKGMLEDYVRNFKANVYGTELQINFEHNRGGEAAGWIKELYIDGDSLMAVVEWTTVGADKIRGKLYKFISSELAPEYPCHDTGQPVSNVFIGAGLTNTPALKGQTPLSLSEEERQNLIHQSDAMFKKLIEALKGRAVLSEADVKLARELLVDVADADKENAEAEVAALETKQKADLAAEEAKKKEAEALAEKNKGNHVSLAEFNALKESNAKLAEQIALRELTEDVSKSLVLSEDVNTGFLDESISEVTNFMLSLNKEQRECFKTLVGKVKYVDFSTRGSSSNGKVNTDPSQAIVDLAETLLKKGEAKSISEAQKMATEQLGKK